MRKINRKLLLAYYIGTIEGIEGRGVCEVRQKQLWKELFE